MARLRIPTRWEDVTADWMTAALASHHPGAVVDEVTVLLRDDGTNRRARLGLTYATGAGPATVFMKAHDPARRLVHLRNGNLFGEARLFSSGVTLGVEHPIVFRAIVDRRHLDFLLVMEDLVTRGADPRDALRPMTVDQVADGVRGLARLHRRFWGLTAKTQPRLRWVRTWKPTKGWQVGLRKRVPVGLERAAEVLPEEVQALSGDEVVDLWCRLVSSLSDGAPTLLHGDAHIGNTYVLPDDSVGFLDWQVVRRGGWYEDLGTFLIGALTTHDRRESERGLVEEYRIALTAAGGPTLSPDEAWLRYRASAAYGMAIWLSTSGTDGYQARDVSLALAERYSAAFMELGTAAALDAIGP